MDEALAPADLMSVATLPADGAGDVPTNAVLVLPNGCCFGAVRASLALPDGGEMTLDVDNDQGLLFVRVPEQEPGAAVEVSLTADVDFDGVVNAESPRVIHWTAGSGALGAPPAAPTGVVANSGGPFDQNLVEVSARPPDDAVALVLFRLDARGGRLFVSSVFAPAAPTVLTDFASTTGAQTYEVIAVDQAGNDSAAAEVTVGGFGCQAATGTVSPVGALVVVLAGLARRRRSAAALCSGVR